MQNKINIGIIGKNFGYNVLYKSFLKSKKYRVKAFSFKSTIKNNLLIPKNIEIYKDWKKLILKKNINAIAIASPPTNHKKIIEFAIKNNKHIFCEKPFATSIRKANYLCNLAKKNKKLSHMVNYEFSEIKAFNFLKKKILKINKINKIDLNWFINIPSRSKLNWKSNHLKGGGMMFNYVCHSIYYLESLFGKISSLKVKISNKNSNLKTLYGNIYFKNGLFAKINIKVGLIPKKNKPIHELKILSYNKIYNLKSKLNSLHDQFELFEINSNGKIKKLFKSGKKKIDFRIDPTTKNLIKFYKSIISHKLTKPNFFDAYRIHVIIQKMIDSSKIKKKIYLNKI